MISIYPQNFVDRHSNDLPANAQQDIFSAVLRVFETQDELREELLRGKMGAHGKLLDALEQDSEYPKCVAQLGESRSRLAVCLALQQIQNKISGESSN